MWLLTGTVAAAWVGLASGRPLLGVVAGCLDHTLAESFFNVSLVYAETVAAGLAAASGLALTRSLAGSPRAAAWRWLAATLALSAAYARPIFQLLLPLFLAFAVARCLGSGRAVLARVALPFVVAIGVGLLPVYVANAVVKGLALVRERDGAYLDELPRRPPTARTIPAGPCGRGGHLRAALRGGAREVTRRLVGSDQ